MLEHQSVLETMHLDDTNIYAHNWLGKCENHPDQVLNMCLADFTTNYVNENAERDTDHEDIMCYTLSVHGTYNKIIAAEKRLWLIDEMSYPNYYLMSKGTKA